MEENTKAVEESVIKNEDADILDHIKEQINSAKGDDLQKAAEAYRAVKEGEAAEQKAKGEKVRTIGTIVAAGLTALGAIAAAIIECSVRREEGAANRELAEKEMQQKERMWYETAIYENENIIQRSQALDIAKKECKIPK